LLGILIFILISGILLSLPFVQTKLGKYATNTLNESFGTNLSIDKVAISAFGNVKLKGITAKDKKNNNLFKIDKLQTSISRKFSC
jgi:regulatory protein YycI of two-component signal transduction system YycFG